MRIVRVLLYDGPEDQMKEELGRSLLHDGVVKEFREMSIKEIFRGQLPEPGKVFFMEPEPEPEPENEQPKIGGSE